jgi:hypothetical protein
MTIVEQALDLCDFRRFGERAGSAVGNDQNFDLIEERSRA